MGQKTMSYLIDSNILIYFLNNLLSPEAEAFLKRAMLNRAYVSVMTRIEILGWPDAETSSAQSTIDLINQFTEQPLTEEIVQKCIDIRCSRRIKIPDAIIAATALHLQMPLVTRNTDDLKGIELLEVINPFALSAQEVPPPSEV